MSRKTQQQEDDFDVERFLRVESNSFSQDKEVERILSDPFVILDMPLLVYLTCRCTEREIKLQYRKRSLLVHPDKNKHPRAQEAFEILKKTEQLCLDPEKKRLVFEYISEARAQVFHGHKIDIPAPEEDQISLFSDAPKKRLDFDVLLEKYPKLGNEVQMQFYKNMVEQGYRDRVRLRNMQEREIHTSEREIKVIKRERDFEKDWDQSRHLRIDSWKKFNNGGKKKRKKSPPPGAI